eukprot:g18402.t1
MAHEPSSNSREKSLGKHQNRPRRSRRLAGSSAVPSAAASTGTPTDGASFPSDQGDGRPVLSPAYPAPDGTRERPLIIDEASPGSGFGEGGGGGGGQEVDTRGDTHRPGSGGGGGGGGDEREEREPGAGAGANGSSPGDGNDDAPHTGSPRAQVCGWQGQIPHSAVANERAGAVASPGTVTGTGGAGTVRPGHGNLAWKAVKIGDARATYVVTESVGALASDGGAGVVPVPVNVNDAAGPVNTVTRGRPLHAELDTKLLRALLHDSNYAHLRRISGVEAGHVDVGAVERAASRGATGAASGGGGAGASGRAIPSKGTGKGKGKGKRTRSVAEDEEEGGHNDNLHGGGGGSVDPGAAATHIQAAAAAVGTYSGASRMAGGGGGGGGGGSGACGRRCHSDAKRKLVGRTGVQDDHDVLLGGGPERTRGGGSGGGGGGGRKGPEGGATRVQKALSASNDGSTIARSSGPVRADPKKKGRLARTGNGTTSRPLFHYLHLQGGHRGVLVVRGKVAMREGGVHRQMANTLCTACGQTRVYVIFDCAMHESVERNLWCSPCFKRQVQLKRSATIENKSKFGFSCPTCENRIQFTQLREPCSNRPKPGGGGSHLYDGSWVSGGGGEKLVKGLDGNWEQTSAWIVQGYEPRCEEAAGPLAEEMVDSALAETRAGEETLASGSEEARPGLALPVGQRRLLGMAAKHALERLGEVDHACFSANTVEGVPGDCEAMEFHIDFYSIRRRLLSGTYGSIDDLAREVQLPCANTMRFKAPGDIFHDRAKWVLVGSQIIWPLAQEILNRLMATETMAPSHGIVGPAASSKAWPLDDHYTNFNPTPANESVTAQARALGGARGDGGGAGADEAVRAAELAASGPATLYTRGEVGDHEKLLLGCLSKHESYQTK